MAKLMLLCGPPASGKTTFAKKYEQQGFVHITQDSQGKDHLNIFHRAVLDGKDIVVDRMGFSKDQRRRYLEPAKKCGYETAITVFHQPYAVCLQRCLERKNHETIKDESNARAALNLFFTKYERVQDDEADTVQRFFQAGEKLKAVYSDLDGTLCNVEHRRHFVRRPDGQKKDWNGFFKALSEDTVNVPVMEVLHKFKDTHTIVYCSGRPDNYRKETKEWLSKNGAPEGPLFMRPRSDSRQDNITKEILLDFEILTRFNPVFFLDDRDQVVKMLRDRGFTVFQVAPGDF